MGTSKKHLCLVDEDPLKRLSARNNQMLFDRIDALTRSEEIVVNETLFEVTMVKCYNYALSRDCYVDIMDNTDLLSAIRHDVYEMIYSEFYADDSTFPDDFDERIENRIRHWCRYFIKLDIPSILANYESDELGYLYFNECVAVHILDDRKHGHMIQFTLDRVETDLPEKMTREKLEKIIVDNTTDDIVYGIEEVNDLPWGDVIEKCGSVSSLVKEYPLIVEGISNPSSVYYHPNLLILSHEIYCPCGFDDHRCALNLVRFVHSNLPYCPQHLF